NVTLLVIWIFPSHLLDDHKILFDIVFIDETPGT
ncbi:MAG: hypothetical protein QOJ51_229, partial [Acidobacteriaceae bacterium]|nr:hypothetical protein [Acidobacteriaceae bacterium]